MSYWLLKTEPSTYSLDDLEREKKAVWDGVSNALALKHLKGMKKADLALVYHSGGEKSIVGTAEIVSNPYPDPKQHDPRFTVVEIRFKERLKRPVSLAAIKARKELADFALVRISRLSVMPVTAVQWKTLLAMSH
ncbi:MAG TPA: EVE domain-containing protein [Bacteroidetes bacterium]|jgi:predicted RNA-binding protein with PUA-like domain|nr:EVE domain-containing protein [Bacteroidota bacterium]